MAHFAFIDSAAADATDNLFGLWGTHAPDPAGVSFSVGATADPAPEVSLWRVSLPADVLLADEQLAVAEQGLGQVASALDSTLARLAAAVTPTGGVSFALPGELPVPEQALLATLAQAEAGGGVSFGIGEQVAEQWESTRQKVGDFIEHTLRSLAYAAWVETELGGRLRGRTVVSWRGGTQTIWEGAYVRQELALHERSLTIALDSRLTLIRATSLAVRGAAIVTRAVSSPVGAVMALPAAWNFVNDVMRAGN